MNLPREPVAAETVAHWRGVRPDLIVAAAILAVFGRVACNGWVEFDDPINVTENPHLIPVTWESLRWLWLHAYERLYIPASYTLFAVEAVVSRLLTGVGPRGPVSATLFHATSLLLHLGCVLVVSRLLRRSCGSVAAGVAGALVFALHPLQVETVAWVSEQRGLLATFFSLVAVEQFLVWESDDGAAGHQWLRWVGGTAAFIIAMLAKPTTVVVPLIALTLARVRPHRPLGVTVAWLTPWFVAALVIGGITRLVQPPDLTTFAVPWPLRPLVAADAVGFYVGKLFMPWNLCVAYGRTPQAVLKNPLTPLTTAVVLVAVGLCLLAPRLARLRAPMLLFLLPLLPVLGLTPFVFQNQSTVADRYVYLAMLGPALAVADRVAFRSGGPLVPVGVAMALTLFAALSFRQAGLWSDTGTLAAHACRIAPGVTASWTLLSGHHLSHGDASAAVTAARNAIAVAPGNRIAALNLSAGLARLGDKAGSRRAFESLQRLGMSPQETSMILYNRGVTHLALGEDSEAAADFALAFDRDSTNRRAARNLVVALTRTGQVEGALKVAEQLVGQEPDDAAAWVGYGNALLRSGRAAEAVACYGRSLAIEPEDAAVMLNRAAARLAAGDAVGASADITAARAIGGVPDADLAAAVAARKNNGTP